MNTFKQYVHKDMNDYFTVESPQKTFFKIRLDHFQKNYNNNNLVPVFIKNVFSGFETNNLVQTNLLQA